MEDIGLLLILHGIYRKSFLYQWNLSRPSAYEMVVTMIIICGQLVLPRQPLQITQTNALRPNSSKGNLTQHGHTRATHFVTLAARFVLCFCLYLFISLLSLFVVLSLVRCILRPNSKRENYLTRFDNAVYTRFNEGYSLFPISFARFDFYIQEVVEYINTL